MMQRAECVLPQPICYSTSLKSIGRNPKVETRENNPHYQALQNRIDAPAQAGRRTFFDHHLSLGYAAQ